MSDFLNRLLFRPGILGLLGNPFYLNRSAIYAFIAGQSFRLEGRILDVGCGTQPYRHLLSGCEYVGLEYDTPHARERNRADCYYTGTTFPCVDGEFTCVLATEVLEHVFAPDEFLAEIHRCMCDGGVLVLTAPFLWDEHEQPYDFARYTSFGVRHLLEKHGFVLVDHKKLNVGICVLVQLANNCIYKIMHVDRRKYRFLLAAVLCVPGNIAGILLRLVIHWPGDIYSNNAVVAVKQSTGKPGKNFA